MQRITISVEEELVEEIDRFARTRGYQNRSEALRDLARHGLRAGALDLTGDEDRLVALVYIYDHQIREREGLRGGFTITTIFPSPPCTSISTSAIAWKRRCSAAPQGRYAGSRNSSLPSEAYGTAGSSSCR